MDTMMQKALEEKLGYHFNNPKLLHLALTHRSFSGEHNNERLEFLGDSIVNFAIAEILFKQFSSASEGELSRWRASLVNRTALAELAKSFSLNQYLLLGQGELRSGGRDRESILSCAMEAIIGAVYLDADMRTCYERIVSWYQPLLSTLTHASSHKDPKSQLQEYLQQRSLPLPSYTVERLTGEAHKQIFYVRCDVAVFSLTVHGQGTSRKKAEQEAAVLMLKAIETRE